MKVEIIKRTIDTLIVHWIDKGQFGTIDIEYKGKGIFTIDSEYLSLDKIIEIIKSL